MLSFVLVEQTPIYQGRVADHDTDKRCGPYSPSNYKRNINEQEIDTKVFVGVNSAIIAISINSNPSAFGFSSAEMPDCNSPNACPSTGGDIVACSRQRCKCPKGPVVHCAFSLEFGCLAPLGLCQ